MEKFDVSIILPCYNEGPTFDENVGLIINVLKNIKKKWEIVFVEDKSTDATKKSVEKLVDQIKNSRAIFHFKNEGRGKSVSDGIKASRGQICGYLDVDCEVSPSYIALFIDEIEKGADMAIGKRFYEQNLKSISRVIASKVYAKVVKLFLNVPIDDTEAGYKFFRKSKILPILLRTKDKRWFWDTEICARVCLAGLNISQIPVLFKKRVDKKSTVCLIPDAIDYITKIIKFRKNMPVLRKRDG